MKRLDPKSLSGPRAYFTDFDPLIIERAKDLETLRKKGERRLKALLLLKGHIVCAASHLANRFAYDFFGNNPVLLTSEAVKPAFRSDKSDLSELFQQTSFPGKDDAAKFFKETISATVKWDLEEFDMVSGSLLSRSDR